MHTPFSAQSLWRRQEFPQPAKYRCCNDVFSLKLHMSGCKAHKTSELTIVCSNYNKQSRVDAFFGTSCPQIELRESTLGIEYKHGTPDLGAISLIDVPKSRDRFWVRMLYVRSLSRAAAGTCSGSRGCWWTPPALSPPAAASPCPWSHTAACTGSLAGLGSAKQDSKAVRNQRFGSLVRQQFNSGYTDIHIQLHWLNLVCSLIS